MAKPTTAERRAYRRGADRDRARRRYIKLLVRLRDELRALAR
jgi:hypothetical protein